MQRKISAYNQNKILALPRIPIGPKRSCAAQGPPCSVDPSFPFRMLGGAEGVAGAGGTGRSLPVGLFGNSASRARGISGTPRPFVQINHDCLQLLHHAMAGLLNWPITSASHESRVGWASCRPGFLSEIIGSCSSRTETRFGRELLSSVPWSVRI